MCLVYAGRVDEHIKAFGPCICLDTTNPNGVVPAA